MEGGYGFKRTFSIVVWVQPWPGMGMLRGGRDSNSGGVVGQYCSSIGVNR